MDRIDIHMEVPPLKYRDLSSRESRESSQKLKKRIDASRKIEASQRRLPGNVLSFDIMPPCPAYHVTASPQSGASRGTLPANSIDSKE
jgi:hypothetical protein